MTKQTAIHASWSSKMGMGTRVQQAPVTRSGRDRTPARDHIVDVHQHSGTGHGAAFRAHVVGPLECRYRAVAIGHAPAAARIWSSGADDGGKVLIAAHCWPDLDRRLMIGREPSSRRHKADRTGVKCYQLGRAVAPMIGQSPERQRCRTVLKRESLTTAELDRRCWRTPPVPIN